MLYKVVNSLSKRKISDADCILFEEEPLHSLSSTTLLLAKTVHITSRKMFPALLLLCLLLTHFLRGMLACLPALF